jgi:hypothetical protein
MITVKKLVRLNIYIFLFYFLAYFMNARLGFRITLHLREMLGVVVFFVAGFSSVKIIERIFKIRFDFWEFLTVGIFASLFIMPVIIFIFYRITGSISEVLTILVYAATSAALLAISYVLERNEFRKN